MRTPEVTFFVKLRVWQNITWKHQASLKEFTSFSVTSFKQLLQTTVPVEQTASTRQESNKSFIKSQ